MPRQLTNLGKVCLADIVCRISILLSHDGVACLVRTDSDSEPGR